MKYVILIFKHLKYNIRHLIKYRLKILIRNFNNKIFEINIKYLSHSRLIK